MPASIPSNVRDGPSTVDCLLGMQAGRKTRISDATFTGIAQTVYDSLVGLEKAIKKARTDEISQLFEKMAKGRRKSHHSLEQALADFGLPPVNSTSMKSDLHRTPR